MKQIFQKIVFLFWFVHVTDASQFNRRLRKDAKSPGRRLISFGAFIDLLTEGGAETADDASSPTVLPETAAASKTEARTTLAPTVTPTLISTKYPTRYPTRYPTGSPTDKPTTDAPATSDPTDRPTTSAPTTSAPSTSSPTTSEPAESPFVTTSTLTPTTSELTKNPTTAPATSNPTTAATPTATPTSTRLSPIQGGVTPSRTSSISLEVKGGTASNQAAVDSICNATQAYVNSITKRSFGKSTVTTVDCNVSMGQVHATTITEFPGDTQLPDAMTYDDYIQVVMISDETISTLPSKIAEATSSLGMDQEVKAAVDTSVHPPVLQLSFEDLHESAVVMRPTLVVAAIMVVYCTALMA